MIDEPRSLLARRVLRDGLGISGDVTVDVQYRSEVWRTHCALNRTERLSRTPTRDAGQRLESRCGLFLGRERAGGGRTQGRPLGELPFRSEMLGSNT